MENKKESKASAIAVTNVAYIGNSMLYFNDTPRFVSNIASLSNKAKIYQDSCLRGGASLISIYTEGNGMSNKFNKKKALKDNDIIYDIGAPDIKSLLSSKSSRAWDYVIMNDFSQSPARLQSRKETALFLQNYYAPLILNHNKVTPTIPILLMTAAYRKPCKGSHDLGSIKQFTNSLYQGCLTYAHALDQALLDKDHDGTLTRIAPVGNAYYEVYLENKTLWEKLYFEDDFHPSICGTFLQGCVLHWTICGVAPSITSITDDSIIRSLWSDARRMYPSNSNFELYFPTKEEALYFMTIAEKVCKNEPTIDNSFK